jgi:hypothetical protein
MISLLATAIAAAAPSNPPRSNSHGHGLNEASRCCSEVQCGRRRASGVEWKCSVKMCVCVCGDVRMEGVRK